MILYIIPGIFFILSVAQTVSKKYNWALPSEKIIMVNNVATEYFEWIGYQVGRYINIMEWLDMLWEFIRGYIWEILRPFFESIFEILQPLWQLLFSWVYFFVGFAKNRSVIFSYLGVIIIFWGLVGVARRKEWVTIETYDEIRRIVYIYRINIPVVLAACFIGTLIAYPNILPKLFPSFLKTE